MSWGMVGAAAGTLIAGYFGNQAAEKRSRGQRALENEQAESIRQTRPMAMNLLNKSMLSMEEYDEFWKKLEKGDRAGAMALLSPQLLEADEQERAATGLDLQTIGRRGGASAEANLASRDRRLANRNNALLGLRTSATMRRGELGLQRAQLGGQLLGATNSGTLGLLGQMANRQRNEQDAVNSAAAGGGEIGGMLGTAWGNRGKSTTPPSGSINQYTRKGLASGNQDEWYS
jgi:hypothetical protein